MKIPLITIGESIHASIPKTGKEMMKLAELGTDAYSYSNKPLDHIKNLIESQAADGATHGQSITDPCLGWDQTERLILDIAERV